MCLRREQAGAGINTRLRSVTVRAAKTAVTQKTPDAGADLSRPQSSSSFTVGQKTERERYKDVVLYMLYSPHFVF